eukprot:GHVU01051709.1.p3 GENE.GHVU01051709.1~~GHVU01051709.1.p3  ORF type:complete len:100 (+),score=0.80 GHVU01051709.1:161-460(+)
MNANNATLRRHGRTCASTMPPSQEPAHRVTTARQQRESPPTTFARQPHVRIATQPRHGHPPGLTTRQSPVRAHPVTTDRPQPANHLLTFQQPQAAIPVT